MPGAIEWLTRMKASGLANFISLVMVQGFLVFDVGHTSGIAHFSMHSLSLLKLKISFPFPASKITACGRFGVMLLIASAHGVSANLVFAMSAAMCTGAVGKTYSGSKASISSKTLVRSPWINCSPFWLAF